MKVLVSGAGGYIASYVVAELLAAGHSVRGTLRDPSKTAAAVHLRALPGAAERLELAAADLNDPHAFDDHVHGVDAVLHTASPYVLDVKDPQRDLVDPAVTGTRGMLAACAKSPGVKRVIVTSSMAAVTDEPDGRVLTEADWNAKSSLTRNPYYYSKTLAERAAWSFMEQNKPGFDLIAINPFLVIGPSMTAALNPSNQVLADLIKGAYPAVMRLALGMVDVRDVALAHRLALENPRAAGRYICAAEVREMAQVVELLRRSGYADRKLPKLRMDNWLGDRSAWLSSFAQPSGIASYIRTHVGRTVRFDNGKISRELGLAFRAVDQSILEAAADLARWGHI